MNLFLLFRNTNKKGFTFIELIVSVAILSVLLTIGNLSYSSYIRKTHSQEAKKNLSLTYAAQKKYHGACGFYFPDLNEIGAVPEGVIHYNIGSSYNRETVLTKKFKPAPALDHKCFGHSPDCGSPGAATCKNYLSDICGNNKNELKTKRNLRCAFKDAGYSKDTKAFIEGGFSSWKTKLYGSTTRKTTSIEPNDFIIFAVSDLKKEEESDKFDVWVINSSGTLKHPQSGL